MIRSAGGNSPNSFATLLIALRVRNPSPKIIRRLWLSLLSQPTPPYPRLTTPESHISLICSSCYPSPIGISRIISLSSP